MHLHTSKFLAALAVASSLVCPAFGLVAGDAVTPDALGKATFVQGAAPAAWEPGKIYFIECWATWCGPCIGAIPHVNSLHKNYADKGLRIVGLNVFDEGPVEKIARFVKTKGDDMAYPVAFVGKGGAFETEWLKPAAVKGIPVTFVVRDGKLLFSTNPNWIKEALVEQLLAGGQTAEDAIALMAGKQAGSDKVVTLVNDFYAARKSKDVDAMAARIAELEKLPEGASYVPSFRAALAYARGDWAALEKEISSGDFKVTELDTYTAQMDSAKVPENVRHALEDRLEKTLGDKPEPMYSLGLLKLFIRHGERERADILVAKMVPGRSASANSLRRIKEGMAKGEIPTRDEYTQWLKDEGKLKDPALH
ncbi:MAG: TlpA disulfide reductase family protein [Luteolibacter sp.]